MAVVLIGKPDPSEDLGMTVLDSETDCRHRRSGKIVWDELLGFLLLVGVVAVIVNSQRGPAGDLVPRGTPLPPLMAEGWLNSDGVVSKAKLAGNVVVVDCWATWCSPCRATMPRLATLYKKYEPAGVKFVGLTPETSADRAAIERFINSVPGFQWPVGYGAAATLDMLGIEVFPTLIVFDAGGAAVWSGSDTYRLAAAIDEATGE